MNEEFYFDQIPPIEDIRKEEEERKEELAIEKKAILELAKEGNVEAQTQVGIRYFDGTYGFERDEKKARTWLKKAADSNSIEAMFFLALSYQTDSNNSGFKKAKALHKKASDEGHLESMFCLAKLYADEGDKEKSMELLKKGAEKGKTIFMLKLADELAQKDEFEEAERWYGEALRKGEKGSYELLGHMFWTNEEQDKALETFKSGYAAGLTYLSLDISRVYEDIADYKQRDKWLDIAIAHNVTGSYFFAGEKYYSGSGVEKDLNKAIELFEKGFEKEDGKCAVSLAELYANGEGVEKNITKAIELYVLAANEYDDPIAASRLGQMYFNGEVLEKDLEKAIGYFEIAASYGEPTSLFNLGVIYSNGYGVEKDYQIAAEYYAEAIENGDKDAVKALMLLVQEMQEGEED